MTAKKAPKPPPTTSTGAALWAAVLDEFELDEHEVVLLRELVRTVDLLDVLAAVVEAEGPILSTPSGPRIHPAVVEARQARIAAARLTAVLRLPGGSEGDEVEGRRKQRRVGTRGVYGVKQLRRVQ